MVEGESRMDRVGAALASVSRRAKSLQLKIREAELARLKGGFEADKAELSLRQHKKPFKGLSGVLTMLELRDPTLATTFKLRYLENRTYIEIQACLSVSNRTVYRYIDRLKEAVAETPGALEALERWGDGEDGVRLGSKNLDSRWFTFE